MSAILPTETDQRSPFQEIIHALTAQRVMVLKPDEVRAYLGQHPNLACAVSAVGSRARQEFGEEAELSLGLYGDPEIEDHYLMLYVRQPVYAPDLLARIRTFRGAFEDALSQGSGWLLVTTDFAKPRGEHAV